MKPGIERLKSRLEKMNKQIIVGMSMGQAIEALQYDGPIFIRPKKPKLRERKEQ